MMGKAAADTNGGDSKSPIVSNASAPNKTDSATTQDNATNAEPSIVKSEPLAPPPRPEPNSNAPDYFSATHSTAHLATEQNPFESSFAGGGGFHNSGEVQTPGGTKLPSVAALTSPAGILGNTPGYWGSLRSGPLSPAMLSGPQKDDYFSDNHHMHRGGFPTPNESGLRSGLTPGGSGSMFPEPSPGVSGLFNGGIATPGAVDFQRTAMNAAAAANRAALNITSQPPPHIPQPRSITNRSETQPQGAQFDQHEANDAAIGLYSLAQQGNTAPQASHYQMASQAPVHAQNNTNMGRPDSSPSMSNQHNGSISNNSGRGGSEFSARSDENDQQVRPNTRGKGKRNVSQTNTTNGARRKDEPLTNGPPSKKAKTKASSAMEPEPQSEEELDMNKDEYNANGKKMTDDEKRKNFLERNRVAALKCRQRKKQWLANLQQKVEVYSQENDQLQGTISQLQNEIVNLKTLLLAHKDCPINQQATQGIMQQHLMDGYGQQVNPYGVAAMNGLMTAGQAMQQRRYS